MTVRAPAVCHQCGDGARLRWDSEHEQWVCVTECGATGSGATPRARRKPKRQGLFAGWWTDPQTGVRLGRVTRSELREAYRLIYVHADIREGRDA